MYVTDSVEDYRTTTQTISTSIRTFKMIHQKFDPPLLILIPPSSFPTKQGQDRRIRSSDNLPHKKANHVGCLDLHPARVSAAENEMSKYARTDQSSGLPAQPLVNS